MGPAALFPRPGLRHAPEEASAGPRGDVADLRAPPLQDASGTSSERAVRQWTGGHRRIRRGLRAAITAEFSLDSHLPYDRVQREIWAPAGPQRSVGASGPFDDARPLRTCRGVRLTSIPRRGGLAIVRPSDPFRKSVPDTPHAARETSPAIAAGSAQGPGKPTADLQTPAPLGESEAAHYASVKQEVSRILGAVAAGTAFRIESLQPLVADMAVSILKGDTLLVHALTEDDAAYDLPRHMTNTAIFAIKIGQGAGCRAEELPWLGLAACIHDVGMTVVPRRIIDKPGALTADETALVRRHPDEGFRLLQKLGAEFEWLANVALQEHERDDGSGYPRGLRGEEVHEYAKIVGLADAYESLTHSRPYRNRRSAFDAVKELITVQRAKFPDRALKGLIRGLSTFPVGSHVRLNTMEIARIVATNPAFPLRPVIEIVAGTRGERLDPPRRVDLSANTLLYVTEACSGKVGA